LDFGVVEYFQNGGGEGFEDFILTQNHFASYKGVNRFRKNFLMDLKEEERTAVGGWQGAAKKRRRCLRNVV